MNGHHIGESYKEIFVHLLTKYNRHSFNNCKLGISNTIACLLAPLASWFFLRSLFRLGLAPSSLPLPPRATALIASSSASGYRPHRFLFRLGLPPSSLPLPPRAAALVAPPSASGCRPRRSPFRLG